MSNPAAVLHHQPALHRDRILLACGIAVPLLYFGNILLSSLFYPGYSHVRQYASELGGPDARWPALFNSLIILLGIVAMAAGLGYTLVLRRLTGQVVLPGLIGLTLALFGFSTLMAGLFPMPDERHGGYGAGMAVHLAPLFLWLSLRRREGLRGLQIYLLVTFVLSLGFFAVMMGAGGLVTRANVGLFQRLYALTAFPWIGLGSYCLLQELDKAPEPSPRSPS